MFSVLGSKVWFIPIGINSLITMQAIADIKIEDVLGFRVFKESVLSSVWPFSLQFKKEFDWCLCVDLSRIKTTQTQTHGSDPPSKIQI